MDATPYRTTVDDIPRNCASLQDGKRYCEDADFNGRGLGITLLSLVALALWIAAAIYWADRARSGSQLNYFQRLFIAFIGPPLVSGLFLVLR